MPAVPTPAEHEPTGSLPAPTVAGSCSRFHLIAGLILALYVVAAVGSMAHRGNAYDEISHLTSGVSHLLTGDYRLNAEQGAFAQRWPALAVAWGPFRFPSLDEPGWRLSNEWWVGQRYFFELGNDLAVMLFRARLMVVLLGVVLGVCVYTFSGRLFGPAGGLISLGLYALNPTILAHTTLTTSDAAAALGFTLAVGLSWRAMQRLTLTSMLAAGAGVSLLFLCKPSAWAVLPMLGVMAVARAIGGPKQADSDSEAAATKRTLGGKAARLAALFLAMAAMVYVSIWAAFGFRFEMMRPDRAITATQPAERLLVTWDELLKKDDAATHTVAFLREHHALPEGYLWGMTYAWQNAQERATFFNGVYSMRGSAAFFPYAFLVKTPIGALGVLVMALSAGVACRQRLWPRLYRLTPWLTLVGVYAAMLLLSPLNIGHRHMLPIYPALFILAGASAAWLDSSRRAIRLAVPTLVLLAGFETGLVYPSNLAFFNALVGGPKHAHLRLVDSSLEWGQALPGLADYLHRNAQPGTPTYLAYFGTGDPRYYGIDAYRLVGFPDMFVPPKEPKPLEPGVYCISATVLMAVNKPLAGPWCAPYEQAYQRYHELFAEYQQARQVPEQFEAWKTRFLPRDQLDIFRRYEQTRTSRLCAWLRRNRPEPDAMIDYSIHVYHLSAEDLSMALDGPPPEPFFTQSQVRD
ncbi:MAG: glycosyltransferase family 39 protein [Phycisphaeraceae bacterium]|nr:glycosyltransferase family 39 protein [Phycisphaeraceae bacterium]